ncbi:MAG TPA: hypothetical protein VLB67_12310, partial [Acidimicrobiia bacterium]|nr:hypothetical protein [Acidimicrobiia bacterium]
RAWIEYGFVAECADPGRVLSLFTSGFDAPFEVGATSYDEIDRGGSPSVEGLLGDRSSFVQLPVVDASGAAPTGGTPVPDLLTATQDGGRTLPLGEVKTLPGTVRLDFLFELCLPEVCFRDAHFIDPAGTGLGSGSFAADEPFHVRHGFPVFKDEPLGQGFDIVVYVTPMDHPGEFGGAATGPTIRHDADYIVRGEAAGCGPTYRSEEDEVTCEWFVHEFPDGLPAGRHALWAMWEAPCWAWIEYGFVEGCADPGEVLSLFASGFDAPFGDAPSYPERDQRPRKSVGAAAG